MDSHEKRLKEFQNKSDEDLLIVIEKDWDKTPDSDLAKAVLQSRSKKGINELRDSINKLDKTTKIFNKKSSEQTEKIIKLTTFMLIMAIVMAFFAAANVFVYIKYAKIQILPIIEQQTENKRRALNYCESCQGPDCKWPKIDGTMMECSEVLELLKN